MRAYAKHIGATMKSSLDLIITSTPVNKTAALVVSGKAEHWEPKRKITQLHWDAPPKCEPLPKGVTDLSGFKIGRLVVARYFTSHRKTGSIWLVRCACGAYETRRTNALENPNNTDDCCNKCRALESARKRYSIKRPFDNSQKVRSREPLPTKEFTPSGTLAEDLTGKRLGKLLVFGNSTETKKWVVLCDCGFYELRNSSYLRRAIAQGLADGGSQCDDCAKLEGFIR
jgi:hypothetical protein